MNNIYEDLKYILEQDDIQDLYIEKRNNTYFGQFIPSIGHNKWKGRVLCNGGMNTLDELIRSLCYLYFESKSDYIPLEKISSIKNELEKQKGLK